MFKQAISVAAVSAFAVAAEEDKGLLAGMQAGFFVPDQKSFEIYQCAAPVIPEMFKQAEAMLPMAEMMFKNATGQQELPAYVKTLENVFTGLEQNVFTLIGGYEGTQFCKGLIVAYHGRNLAMKTYSEMPAMHMGGPFAALQ